ncbi:DUF86 domain-containing protein [Synechococcus sp. PCC 7336]|uniref:type VII toxin-antitoxin system HepT family RNase toxin n=1 Tax=Synechococcus sp. PCC 7336 TaxID=195250 RepID=UPI00034C7D02|nr:DUF86 domain-containing protein [Synechococcus sp. PCC 7336]
MNEFNLDILSRKIDVIRRRLERLQKYRLLSLEDYLNSDDIQDIIERNLEVSIQAAIDVNKSLLKRVLALNTQELQDLKNSESFLLLAQNGILTNSLANELARSAGFRNVLAHLYDELIPERVIDALQKALKFYPEYLYEIQSYLGSLED